MHNGRSPLNGKDLVGCGTDCEGISREDVAGESGRQKTYPEVAEIVVIFGNASVFESDFGKTVEPTVSVHPRRGPLNEQDFLFTGSETDMVGHALTL